MVRMKGSWARYTAGLAAIFLALAGCGDQANSRPNPSALSSFTPVTSFQNVLNSSALSPKVSSSGSFFENVFRVEFPAQPGLLQKKAITLVNNQLELQFYEVHLVPGDYLYRAGFIELPKLQLQDQEILEALQNQTIAEFSGTLIDQKEIKLDQFPGREFSFKSIFRGRVYLAQPRIYQVICGVRAFGATVSDSCLQFQNSFRIIG